MDMNVIIDRVVCRCTMADVRVGDESYLFKYFKISVDGRQIYTTCGALHMSQNLVRRPVTKVFNRLEY
jgi:hypothetical protein